MTEQTATPDYIKEGDGFAVITLRGHAQINGIHTSAIRMREPTVEDGLTYAAMKGSDATKEAALFANLCDVAIEDLKKLTLRNYHRLQEAYGVFTV